MSVTILNCRQIANDIKKEVIKKIEQLQVIPTLAVVLVGEDIPSQIYVNRKRKTCEECGIKSRLISVHTDVTTNELVDLINGLNDDPDIHGILVQLPLPDHIDKFRVLNEIDSCKDVDGFSFMNIGLLTQGVSKLQPCTPAAVMEVLRRSYIETKGKNAVIINRSLVVGQPLSTLLLRNEEFANCTVTVCHDHTPTKQLINYTRNADIIITAVGKRDVFSLCGDIIKPDSTVIDVGITRYNGKIVGDCEESVADVARYITVVPNGIGLVTCAVLMKNTIIAAEMVYENS
jgi:methylenetetrahydrofolate dehydrogenase (NADP+)/methenyltetrahydrofolate cyclohydrolase